MTEQHSRPAGSLDTVGVIGLGIMGSAIARNLVRAGFRVLGYDTAAERRTEASMHGVSVAHSAQALAGEADVILTSLPSSEALEHTASALMRSDGKRGRVVAELSTLAVASKLACRDRLVEAGWTVLDCPLSGTGAQAATGDLIVYGSGDRAGYDRCIRVFEGFSRRSYYLGEFGNGTKMKLVANLLVAVHNVAAAEAIVLGLRAGLDPATLCEVAGSGAGASRVLELRGPMMVAGTFEPPSMKLEVWQKDMALIREFARDLNVTTPLFSAAAPIYDAAIAAGRGQQDTAAVAAVLADMPAVSKDGG